MIEVTITVTVDGVTKLKTVGLAESMDSLPHMLKSLLNIQFDDVPQAPLNGTREDMALALMAQLGGRGYPVERAKVRTWLANLRAERMKPPAFDHKVSTMRAWLSMRKKK